MRITPILTAAAISLSAFTIAGAAQAQYVDLYELGAYCQAGYIEACQMLNYYAQQMQPSYGGYHDPNAAHMQRMQDIHDWGQTQLAIGAQNSAIMDQRHESFLETLRN